ncbi:TPR-like protein [Patellaria atrata CBS 101060]|uniref:TPR-like protein n=1 Tax=Patellaria atrata CBS 101060 TaxID=1346257 RepID=A0A9P4S3Z2_9PEZI|nr:TPR-like protein [Patellaria atrata CBS 101060]
MSSIKAALKAAKAALDAQKYEDAVVQANNVLASDPQNYFATIFLGRAHEKSENYEDAAKAYTSATKLKPKDDQAWLGLRSLYESQGSSKVDEYITVGVRLAEIYGETDDNHRCASAIHKVTDLVKVKGTTADLKRTLEIQLPTSPIYSYIEGFVPHPSHTYLRLAEIIENEEKERINKLIGERRTRLGARIAQVTTEAKREVLSNSPLEDIYQKIIDWTNDDDVRRDHEEKLLRRCLELLHVLPKEHKETKRKEVEKIARGMVIVKHKFQIAWCIDIEWKDVENIQEHDGGVLREFVEFFPESGLSEVLKGYLGSEISPFPLPQKDDTNQQNGESDDNQDAILSTEDRLILMTEGLDLCKESILAHRLMGDYYLYLEEYESAVDIARKGLRFVRSETDKSGLALRNHIDALNIILATSLIHYQSPKNHPEAKSIFNELLKRKPSSTPALIGVGLILEEEEEYEAAIDFLGRALMKDPGNTRIGAEVAWCKALNGNLTKGLEELETYVEQMEVTDTRSRDLRSQTLYRIGKCMWDLNPARAARKDRNGAYTKYLASIKTNPNYAPAYTSLGFFYSDYARDKRRARQCFQKAFELSVFEIEAAERLARAFADEGDWDIVEVVAQRAIDSGKRRPAPGSKKKGISWPYSALGVVQMNKQEYAKAVVSFLAALRISPDDYHSYVGLGEAYHNSGRYNSAARTFNYAEHPEDGVQMKKTGESWFTQYMLANVKRELGQYDDAIDGYKHVLSDRPTEFGVSITLLQTLVERAWRCVETGFFGKAADSAIEAIGIAEGIAKYRPDAFNLWKALGDASSVFSFVQSRLKDLPFEKVQSLLGKGVSVDQYDLFQEADGINKASLQTLTSEDEGLNSPSSILPRCLNASILAHKRAINSCAHDIHAQAVAWFNLGWTEFRVHKCLETDSATGQTKQQNKFLKASMRCFKRAIELEAGNSEFWNALGVVTTKMNPKVAQHSFVRSLHLNERSVRTWTNLGVLYLLQNDLELAHQAFSRAQSTDPDYAHAWLGEGLVALLWGDTKEALAHFTHAYEISDSGSLIAKRQYTLSAFDHLISSSNTLTSINDLIQPLFALEQLRSQEPSDLPHNHLAALFLERVGKHDEAITTLEAICTTAESNYEVSESPSELSTFAKAKTDLARNRLAVDDYSNAATDAETALDLMSEEDSTTLSKDALRRTRLSAHITTGLSHFYLCDIDASLATFRTALEESGSAPDVVCLLARILWAKGGTDEKAVAKEQLFDAIERHPGHVGASVLIGAIAAIEGDEETMEAVRDDLESLRTEPKLSYQQKKNVEGVLEAIAALGPGGDEAELEQLRTAIMLTPAGSHGWSLLAGAVEGDGEFAARMALKTAQRQVPPRGAIGAEELARTFAGTGSVGDAQRAVMVAPWLRDGWECLVEAVDGVA